MKKFETLVGSDAAGTLKDLPLDEAGLGQEGAAASNGAVVRSDLPLFKTDDRGVELADEELVSDGSNKARSGAGQRIRSPGLSNLEVERSVALPFENRTSRLSETVVVPRSPKRAGVASRLGAGVVDLLLIAGIDAVVLVLTSRLAGIDFAVELTAALVAPPLVSFLFLLNLGYVLSLTLLSGQTLGKMLFSIRVVNNTGGKASARQIIIRALGWLASCLLLGIGFLFLLFGKKRGLHDLAAGTDVVRC